MQTARRKNVYLAAIKNSHIQDKNKNLNRSITKIRSTYELVFSKQNRRVLYIRIAKNQFVEFMQSICFNLLRLNLIRTPSLHGIMRLL